MLPGVRRLRGVLGHPRGPHGDRPRTEVAVGRRDLVGHDGRIRPHRVDGDHEPVRYREPGGEQAGQRRPLAAELRPVAAVTQGTNESVR